MPLDAGSGGYGKRPSRNVLGGTLENCSLKPMTGFFRNGCCDTSAEDVGSHTVCVVMTAEFLAFSNRAATICRRRCRNTASPGRARRPLVPVRAALAGGAGSRKRAARGAARDP